MPEALPEALVATEDFSLIALFLRADPIVQAVMAHPGAGLGLVAGRSRSTSSSRSPAPSRAPSGSSRPSGPASRWKTSTTASPTSPPRRWRACFAAGAREWRDSRRGAAGRRHQPRDRRARRRSLMDVAVNRETQRMEIGPVDAGDHRLVDALHRPARHRHRHHELVPRHRRAGRDQPDRRRARHRRGAVRNRARPVRGHPGADLLQQVLSRRFRLLRAAWRTSPRKSRRGCRKRLNERRDA